MNKFTWFKHDIKYMYIFQGPVKSLEFHPSAQVALTAGLNNTLSLFQVRIQA